MSILGETRLFLLQRQIGHKDLQELTVELINLPSSTKDYHCETRLVWDLPCRHELGSVMIDGTIEMESIPKRRWWVDEVKGNSLSNQVVDVLNPKHYMKWHYQIAWCLLSAKAYPVHSYNHVKECFSSLGHH
ncbi:hypothetical protein PS6_008492 [Mucor atramentarius]